MNPLLTSQADPDSASMRAEIARTVRGVCPAVISAQAEDIAHEVLLRLLEKAEGKPVWQSSYWRKAAYHAVIDELRRRRSRREDSLDDQESNTEPAAAPIHDPQRQLESAELGAAIGECVKGLRETRRPAVVLFLQGHSAPESAALLNWAVKRLESSLYRGLQDLRDCLTGKGWSR